MKAFRAAIGGSALAAIICTVALAVFNVVAYQWRSADFVGAMMGFLPLSFFATAALACTLGLGWHAFARGCGWSSVHAYWPPAVLVGVAPVLFFMVVPTLEPGAELPTELSWLSTFLLLLLLGASLGGLTAVFAWMIRRPDRDPPNPPTSGS